MASMLAYLSGGARVSSRPMTEASGPRAHVMGILQGFQQLGWGTRAFILGDHLPSRFSRMGSERLIIGGGGRTYLADLVRLGLRPILPGLALRRLGDRVDWAYERFSSMQSLGAAFQRRGIPWILETNGLLYTESSKDRRTLAMVSIAKTMELQAYQRCDVLICPSQALADVVVGAARINPDKVVLAPNGVDFEQFTTSRQLPRRLAEGATLGFAGALNSWQALHLPIEAIAELRQEGIDFQFVIVGDGPMRGTWENLSRSIGQAAHIHFVGQVPSSEVPGYILGFDLGFSGHIAPTTGKMYYSPLKIYEYMAAGRPVVASEHAEAAGALMEGSTGYLFRPGDKEDLKRALRTAFARRDRWPEDGAQARTEAATKHTWAHRVAAMIPRVEAILEDRFDTAYPARSRR